jgi:2-oxoisovalerate dehydrogenase E1 component alpha subunit
MVKAEAPQVAPASTDVQRSMFRDMVRSRELSERMFALNRQGRATFAVSGQGHEAAQIGSAYALRRGTDWVLPYYRDVGVMLSLGMTPYQVLLGLFAKLDDPSSGGRQMPCHWSFPEARVVTRSSVIAANLPHAAGVAYASKLRGLDEVAIVYFGEGATSEGDFHEGLNFAAIHHLPVIFFCENNGYAISEKSEKQMAVRHVADRAKGYGVSGQSMDGNDVMAVYQATKWAIEECRAGHGPRLIEAKTYRFGPHTSSDDDRRYRARTEVEEWAKRDPVDRFRKRLIKEGTLTEDEARAMREEARREVDEAVDAAEHAPDPTPEQALRYVFADPPAGRSRTEVR